MIAHHQMLPDMTGTDNYQSLFTEPADERLRRFADMRSLYPTRVIRCGPEPRALASGPQIDVIYAAEGRRFGIDDFIRRYTATGLLILHRGQVVCERHASGHTPETRWISFSMAKSITSTLVGVALHEGLIDSLDDPVVRTVPRLSGSAYDGVRIRDVLQMSTGVGWVETYLDPESDRRKLMALQVQERPGLVLDYLACLPRVAEPGTRFNYNTAETFLLGAILAGAIRRPLSDYLSEKIWRPCGMECDAYWQLESAGGQEFAGSGLSATLRDYGRFGLFVLRDGVVAGQRLLPEGWMRESTAVVPGSPLAPPGGLPGYEPLGYGYQWWTFPQLAPRRVFGALGIFGQQIYVDVDAAVVIVVHGAWPQPVHDPSRLESYTFFEAVTEALKTR
jgi:CubicO group peptidase (beta-lactamase class C family)